MNPCDLVIPGIHPRYRSVEWIATGGLADVFEAEDTLLLRRVAIKRVRRCFAENRCVDAHWGAEAHALRRLEGVEAPRLLDEGFTLDGLRFLVLELVPGWSFHSWLETTPTLGRALAMFTRALDALDRAHRAGVVHGDFKSSNVMLSPDLESLWLIDFGLAEIDGVDGITPRGVGTPEYVAPEVVAGERHSVASDVYAAGAVLYELLTGSPPFTGESVQELLDSHCFDPVSFPSSTSTLAISRQLDAIVTRALAKRPAERFASVAAMREEIVRSRATWPEQMSPRRHLGWDRIATAPWLH